MVERSTSEPPPQGVASVWRSLDEQLIRWWAEHGCGRPNRPREKLGPFMKWCLANGIAPEFVADRTITNYIASQTYKRKSYYRPQEAYLRRSWNFAASRVPTWPAVWVSLLTDLRLASTERGGHMVCFAERQFRPSLVAEVKRYRAHGGLLIDAAIEKKPTHRERMDARLRLLNGEGIDQQRPYSSRPLGRLSRETVYTQCRIIYMTATALHLAGEVDVASLHRIADVLTPNGAALLADAYEKRLGATRGRPAAAKCVRYMLSIATRCGIVYTAAEREALRDLQNDLYWVSGPAVGISESNLRKLAQFDDPTKFCMLLALPDVVMAELEQSRERRGYPIEPEARRAKWAIAIEVLNTIPLRRETLVCLEPDRNFVKERGGHPKLLVFADQEKTGKVLEARLTGRTWRMIQLYLRHYRPVLQGSERSKFLFPGVKGDGHTWPQALAREITRLVKERIGVHIHPHLWRHLMSSKLGEATGRVEDAEKLLGHVPSSRATKRYARLRSKAAAEMLRAAVTTQARREGIKHLRKQGRHEPGTVARR